MSTTTDRPRRADDATLAGGLWRDMWRLVKEFWSAHPIAALGLLVLLVIGNVHVGVTLLAMRGLVDALAGEADGGRSAMFWAWVFVAAGATEEFYLGAGALLRHYLIDHGIYRIQRRVLERAAAAPLIQFEEGEFFDHLQRANRGMGERLVGVSQAVLDLSQVMVMGLSVAGALFVVHPLLLPLMIVGTLPSLWLQSRTAVAIYYVQREHTTRDRVRMHLQSLLTGREAAAEIRLFGSAGYLLGRWRRLRDEQVADVVRAERERAMASTLGGLFAGGAYAGALVLVSALILRGELSVGGYVAVATGALWFDQLLGAFVQVFRSLKEQSRFLGDLFDFWRVARDESSGEDDGAGSRTREGAIAVEAKGLRFAYPGQPRPVIRNVSVHIAPGERVAIVGENGAGKTTLAKLLVGMYRPDEGVVRLDGTELRGDHAVGVRRRVAAVFQDYATFQLTVRENIGFGNLDRIDDDRALIGAAERAGAGPLIERMADGLDAYLGRQFGETELSGGEWQRIALSRAFFRDADLLLLDEPTAALDPLAELALFERFAELAAGRTAIMISHRLGAARLADRVIVMRDGEIVEDGHHDDLVARNGVYAELFAAQAQWYR